MPQQITRATYLLKDYYKGIRQHNNKFFFSMLNPRFCYFFYTQWAATMNTRKWPQSAQPAIGTKYKDSARMLDSKVHTIL